MTDEIVELDSKRKHFAVLALCLECDHRWLGQVITRTSLFHLECPRCREQRSFASFVPGEYLLEFKK